MYHLAFLVLVTTIQQNGCQNPALGVAPALASTGSTPPQVIMPTSKSPWKTILENSCKKSPFKDLCKLKDIITGSQNWQVFKLLGENGSNLLQKDACGNEENSIKCYSGKVLKHSYNKLKLMLDQSLTKYTDRFSEDKFNGWTEQGIKHLFDGIEQIPDKTEFGSFQNDRFQSEALLRLMGMVRLLQVRMEDFKINALLFAMISLTMTLTVLLFYTIILVYVATKKCQIKMSTKRAKKLKQQERNFRRIIAQERREEGAAELFELN